MTKRTYWYAEYLGIEDEPLALSLLKYRQKKNRRRVLWFDTPPWAESTFDPRPNLISSMTDDGRQMPIIDLDFDHAVVKSTSNGHAHLYLNVPISKFRWFCLMTGLYLGKQIEMGFYVWSLRRGGNFVRIPEVSKKTEQEFTKPTYGWFFKLRDKK